MRRARYAIAVMAGIALAGMLGVGSGSAEEDFVAGSGNAYAQVYRVGPTAARLSLAPVIGLSLADYVNTVGRGETKAADWAGIGVAERSLPDNTPYLRVTSTDKDSEKGKTTVVVGRKDPSGAGGGAVELFARATDAPLGESRVRLGSMAVPGLIEFSDGEAHTIVGVDKGNTRKSTAIVEFNSANFAGAVTLSGLRWEAVQITGPGDTKKLSGKFTIQGAAIGGTPLPIPDEGAELGSVIEPINAALAPAGFAISTPESDTESDVARVSPLSFDIVNSPAGRQFLAPILEALQPVREPIADGFIDLAKQLEAANEDMPDASVAVLAADLTLGIASGSSQLHIELGGVNAFTEGNTFENPFGFGSFRPPATGPQNVFVPGTPGTQGVPGVTGDKGVLVAQPAGPAQRTVPGGRGGIAIAVGIAGIIVAIVLAVADYRRMRASRAAA